MKIVVDAMGGDNAPKAIVQGTLAAAAAFNVDLVLAGDEEAIRQCLTETGKSELPSNVSIVHTTQIIEMEDDPALACKLKPDSSMTVGLRMVQSGEADAFVSAGSTGALLTGATLIVKRIRGIRRAAMAPYIPNRENGVVLIDCGANAECTPEYLLQFAYLGSYYAEKVVGLKNPRVGLLNIGAEETKGTALQQETYALLKAAGESGRLNFAGNCEARDVMNGGFDVVVCDGFSGNVLLKSIEGMGLFMFRELKNIFLSGLKGKLAALLVKKEMYVLKKKLDVSEVGGTEMLGISRPVIKAHGSSDARAIKNAIRQAMKSVEANLADDIRAHMEEMKISQQPGV